MKTQIVSVSLIISVFLWPVNEAAGESTAVYLGCFEDGGPSNRMMRDHHENFPGTLTPDKCNEHCLGKGFSYAGTQFGSECFCSKTKPSDVKRTWESDCNSKCSGDEYNTCGGDNRLAVFTTGVPDTSESTVVYLGCFQDGGPSNRVMRDHHENFPGTLTPDKCNERCLGKGFPYAGTQFGSECFCSKTRPQEVTRALESDCNSKCSGDEYNTCGGDNRLAVFTTGVVVTADGLISSTELTTPPRPCVTSETVVAGKSSVCRGDVIFDDQFSTPLGNTWSHVIMIPDDPDFSFAVFTADSENSFTRKNNLVIKPTFLNNTFVQFGRLNLSRCTGRAGSRQCELQAFSYNILPPLKTARIHTRDSFSFRYGIVEIRAKLPLGDWLVPELWLEPRQQYYGPGYTSGRIKIAMNRGNSDFKCQKQDYGSNHLESGLLMGPANNVQQLSLTTKLPDNWHDHFHNYTLIWSPESISFKIDQEKPQGLFLPGIKLCEVFRFRNNECLFWSTGSRIAPFDRDFYISLGLSVGNSRDFPDECRNRGKKSKPWTNLDPKATLRFWQDRENWKATWSEENSSLQVEHVRVTAL